MKLINIDKTPLLENSIETTTPPLVTIDREMEESEGWMELINTVLEGVLDIETCHYTESSTDELGRQEVDSLINTNDQREGGQKRFMDARKSKHIFILFYFRIVSQQVRLEII